MRLLTFNTRGMRGDWAARLPVFREGFRALDPDIVTLQETILTDHVDQAADMLGPEYHLAQQRDCEHDGQGITTAGKWPLGQAFEIDFHLTERTRDFACTCLVTEILAPRPLGRQPLPRLSARSRTGTLPAKPGGRAPTGIARCRITRHVIVAGDMDADADADSMRFWAGRHVIEDMSVCYRRSRP